MAPKVLANVARTLPAKYLPTRISLGPREAGILELPAQGLSNANIAQRLYLSEGAIHNYMNAHSSKLEVSVCTPAVVVALRHGLVDINKL